MSKSEPRAIPCDGTHSRVLITEDNAGEWIMFEQDGDQVCLSRRQADAVKTRLDAYTEKGKLDQRAKLKMTCRIKTPKVP